MISLLQQTATEIGDTTRVVIEGASESTDGTSIVVETIETSANGAAAPAAAASEHASGMPQLDVTTFANQIFWLVVTMVAIWWVLTRVALPRISAVLADRQNTITGDIDAAEELRSKAREAEAAYDEALARARADAQGIAAQQKAAMQEQIDAAIRHADAEIAARSAESEQRIGEIRSGSIRDAREVAREVTAELVRAFGGKPDDAAVADAVDRHLQGTA